jgi:hypothetical protein
MIKLGLDHCMVLGPSVKLFYIIQQYHDNNIIHHIYSHIIAPMHAVINNIENRIN